MKKPIDTKNYTEEYWKTEMITDEYGNNIKIHRPTFEVEKVKFFVHKNYRDGWGKYLTMTNALKRFEPGCELAARQKSKIKHKCGTFIFLKLPPTKSAKYIAGYYGLINFNLLYFDTYNDACEFAYHETVRYEKHQADVIKEHGFRFYDKPILVEIWW